jgi:hypothetical protein
MFRLHQPQTHIHIGKGRGWTTGFVWRIEESTKLVGVKFENDRVNMELLLEDLEASIRLESRGEEDNWSWPCILGMGLRARSLLGCYFGWHYVDVGLQLQWLCNCVHRKLHD